MKCVVRMRFIFANQDPFAKMTWKFLFPTCMASESYFNPALLKLSSRPNSNTRKPVSEYAFDEYCSGHACNRKLGVRKQSHQIQFYERPEY